MSLEQHYGKKHENSDHAFGESFLSTADVLRCISDKKTLSLFKAIVTSRGFGATILMAKLRLSRKQYYKRMEKLIHNGLVIRTHGKYRLTSFGMVIFSSCVKIEIAIEYYWKLKAIDSMTMSAEAQELPLEERQRIIDSLIHNHEIKDILIL